MKSSQTKIDVRRRNLLRRSVRYGVLGLVASSGVIPLRVVSAQDAGKELLRLYTYAPGSYGQIAAITWQKLIYGKAKLSRLETLPMAGREQYVEYTQASQQQNSWIMLSMSPVEAGFSVLGLGPWADKLERPPMAIMTFAPNSAVGLFTKNKEIKTIYDLQGKRVDLGLEGDFVDNTHRMLMEAAGVEYEAVPSPSQSVGWQRLRDDLVDATGAGIIDMRLLPPAASDVMRSTEVYQIDVPEELFEEVQKKTQDVILPHRVQHGAYKQSYGLSANVVRAQEGVLAPSYTPGFWASPNLEEDIVYEITKIALDNVKVFGDEHALGKLLPDRIGHMTAPKAMFHPGARRAYDELGIGYGLEDIAA